MNVQNVVGQAGRFIDGLQDRARELLARETETEEPPIGALWEKLSPGLEKTLSVYDRKESPDTPQSSWIPGHITKESCQRNLEDILDAALTVLGTCGAARYRTRIQNLLADIATRQGRIAKYHERYFRRSPKSPEISWKIW